MHRISKRKTQAGLTNSLLAHLNHHFRIANVILQSGFTVPEWIAKLPKPSKMKRRQMGKTKRPDIVNPARHVGRRDSVKKRCVMPVFSLKILPTEAFRDMVMGSKRRALKNQSKSTTSRDEDADP